MEIVSELNNFTFYNNYYELGIMFHAEHKLLSKLTWKDISQTNYYTKAYEKYTFSK